MSTVKRCYDITRSLIDLLRSSRERDEILQGIEELLAARQALLNDIQPPYSEEEKELGKQIVIWNQEIESKMILLRAQVKRDMNSVIKTKTTAKKYTNPYESLQFDGMFYDKKK